MTITAAATLAVIEEGLLGLEEPVDRLLPELADRRVLVRPSGPLDETVPAERPITTRDLLTFTFGFGMAMEMFTSREPWPVVEADEELGLASLHPPDPSVQPDPDTWIANLGTLPLIAQPGERWLYNTGASVLGVLVARATGQPFGEVLRTRLLEPLGMRDTAFWTSKTDRLATAYRPTPNGLVVWDEPGGTWSRPVSFAGVWWDQHLDPVIAGDLVHVLLVPIAESATATSGFSAFPACSSSRSVAVTIGCRCEKSPVSTVISAASTICRSLTAACAL